MDYCPEKREHYHRQFFNIPLNRLRLLSDTDLAEKSKISAIRHIGKLTAIRDNALAWQALKQQGINPVGGSGTLSRQHAINNDVPDYRTAPAQTSQSQNMSKTLKTGL